MSTEIKVLDDPDIAVRLYWRAGGQAKWQQFGVDCRVADLPGLALNVVRKRVASQAAVVFGITVCGNGQEIANLRLDDLERILAAHAEARISEEGLAELRQRLG